MLSNLAWRWVGRSHMQDERRVRLKEPCGLLHVEATAVTSVPPTHFRLLYITAERK